MRNLTKMSSMAGLSSSCELHTNVGSTNLATQGMSSNDWSQNSATPHHLVITQTQLGSPSSEGGSMLNNCIQYSAQDDVLSMPKFIPENSPAITNLLESVLDEGHIEESLNPANKSMLCQLLSISIDGREGNDSGLNDPKQHEHGRSPNMTRKASGLKTSQYRGVTKCNEDRFEAFVWDNSIPGRRGRTVYIGGYSTEIEAARAHDLISLKIGGLSAFTNFPVRCYWKEIHEMQNMSKREYILAVRGRGKGFCGSDSDYRGVYRITEGRQWQAWLGRDKGLPSIFLGTYYTPEDAARAYDIASIRFKGMEAITNFELTSYNVRGILEKLKNPAVLSVLDSLIAQKRDEEVLFQSENNEAACPPNVNQPENNSSSSSLHQHNHQLLTTQLSNSSSSSSPSFQSYTSPDLIQSSSYNLGRLTEIGSQLSNSSSSSIQGCQNPNLIQSSPHSLDGLTGTGSQLSSSQVSNSSSSSSFFQGYQNPDLIQSSPYNLGGLTGTRSHSQVSNSSSSSFFFQGYQNPNLIQSSPYNLCGWTRTRSQQNNSSSSSFQGYQNSNHIQSSLYNLGGLTRTICQLSNSSSPPPSFQSFQNSICTRHSPYNLGRLTRSRSGLSNSSSSLSSFQCNKNSNCIQRIPYNLVELTRIGSQMSNSSLSSFHGYQNPNLIQSSPHNFDGLTGTRPHAANYGTSSHELSSTTSPSEPGASLQQSILLPSTSQSFQAPQALQNQVHVNSNFNQNLQNKQYQLQRPSLLISQGNQSLESHNFLKHTHLPPDFGTRLLGGDVENLSSAFNVEPPTHHLVTETPGPRAANNGVSSFGLLNNSIGINHVDVIRPPNQVPGAAQPQQPPLVQSHEPNHPNNLNQNTHKNLNSCSSTTFQNPCSQANAGSRRQINQSEDDFDITQYLNTTFMEENSAGDFDAW